MESLFARLVAGLVGWEQNNFCPDRITWIGPGQLKEIRVDGKLWRRSLAFKKTCVTSFKEGYMIVDGKRILDCPGKDIGIASAIAMHDIQEHAGAEVKPAKVVSAPSGGSKFKKGKGKGGK